MVYFQTSDELPTLEGGMKGRKSRHQGKAGTCPSKLRIQWNGGLTCGKTMGRSRLPGIGKKGNARWNWNGMEGWGEWDGPA